MMQGIWFTIGYFYHKNTQNHVKKHSLYFHIRGWPGYFESGHAGLTQKIITLLDKTKFGVNYKIC